MFVILPRMQPYTKTGTWCAASTGRVPCGAGVGRALSDSQWWRNAKHAGRLFRLQWIVSGRKPADLSPLSNQLVCRTCHRWCAVPLHRTKHEGPAGRAQVGGHDDLSSMTSAPQHHGAFWHFPPRRAFSLEAMANHATHPMPRARESIGSVSVVITA